VRQAPTEFERFLRRLQRRDLAGRCLDGVIAGLACGTVIGMGLEAWSLTHGQAMAGGVAAAMAIGTAIGAIVAAWRRPSLAGIAARADGVLGLHELFSTAFYLQSEKNGGFATRGDDAWASAVIACADRRSADLRSKAALPSFIAPMVSGRLRAASVLLALAVLAFSGLPGGASMRRGSMSEAGVTGQVIPIASTGPLRVFDLQPPTPIGIDRTDELASHDPTIAASDAKESAQLDGEHDATAGRHMADRAGAGSGRGEAHTDDAIATIQRGSASPVRSHQGGAVAGGGTQAERATGNAPDAAVGTAPFAPGTAGISAGSRDDRPRGTADGALGVARDDRSTDAQADLVRDFFGLSQP
jgi:hypothetical protein